MVKHKDRDTCPWCGEQSLTTRWSSEGGRKQQEYCISNTWYDDPSYCGWEGVPYTPAKKRIKTTKKAWTEAAAWCYELFDQYGHVVSFSVSFASEKAATSAAKRDVEHWSANAVYGKCTAVVWPPSVEIHGKVVK